MPRTPTIFLNSELYKRLEEKAKMDGYCSVYAYMKSLIIEELTKPRPNHLIRNYSE